MKRIILLVGIFLGAMCQPVSATIHTAANAFEVIEKVGIATAGDTINLAAGTFDCRRWRLTISGWNVVVGNRFRIPTANDPDGWYIFQVLEASVSGGAGTIVAGVITTGAVSPGYATRNPAAYPRFVMPTGTFRVVTGSGSTFTVTAATYQGLAPAAGVTINGHASGSTIWSSWSVDNAGSASVTVFNSVKFKLDGCAISYGAVTGAADWRNGSFQFNSCEAYGPTLSATPGVHDGVTNLNCALFAFVAGSAPIKADLRWSTFHDVTDTTDQAMVGDVVAAQNTGSSAQGLAGYLRTTGCFFYGNGYGGSDQLLTTHDDVPLVDVGSKFYGLRGAYSAVAPGRSKTNSSRYTSIKMFGSWIIGGTVGEAELIDGCLFECATGSNPSCLIQYGTSAGTGVGTSVGVVRNSRIVMSNTVATAMVYLSAFAGPNSDVTIENNVFDRTGTYGSCAMSIWEYGTNAPATAKIHNNRFNDGGYASATRATEVKTVTNAGGGVSIKNNIFQGSWVPIVHSGTTVSTISYNLWSVDPTGFTPDGTNTKAAAQLGLLDSTPVDGGNCDQTGDATVTFTTAKDYYGRPRFYYPDGVTKKLNRGPVAANILAMPAVSSVLANAQVGNGQTGTLAPY